MNIITISLDTTAFDATSSFARRLVEYGDMVDTFTVVVPSREQKEVRLSSSVMVYGSGGKNKFIQLIKLYRTVARLLAAHSYDVISVQDPYYLGLIGLLVSKRFTIGLEVQVHGLEAYSFVRKICAGLVIPNAHIIRVVSVRLRRYIEANFAVPSERIKVVPIHVDITPKRNITTDSGKKETEEFIFMTVGRLVSVKNISMQMYALKEVVHKYPRAKLWVVGNGPQKSRLEALSKKLNIYESVIFWGWQKDVDTFFVNADILLLTSYNEGFGRVVVEAAVHALPTIMTNVGIAGEVLRNEKECLVTPVGDQDGLRNAMVRLIENRQLRTQLGSNASRRVQELPDKEETLALYKKNWELAARYAQN